MELTKFEKNRRRSAARWVAVKRLITRYPNLFERFYQEEKAARGLTTTEREVRQ